jgi:dTDP-4-dehydrorhamnose reductase
VSADDRPERVLILGGAGMLGHKLVQAFGDDFETWTTLRGSADEYARYELLTPSRVISGIDALNFEDLIAAFASVRPHAVINCIGIIKQLPTASDPILNLTINSLLPHRLQRLCHSNGARLIHFSTDCVFNGRRGGYTEDDPADAVDLYGRSKSLGETSGKGAVTIRSSVVGRELATTSGLVEWFLAQRGRAVKGYTRAVYSGFTTQAMARIVRSILLEYPALCGTVQISSEPISKYDLLGLVREAYRMPVEIVADDTVKIDRSLDSSRFRSLTAFVPPSWPDMIGEMAADPTPYDEWRRSRRDESG